MDALGNIDDFNLKRTERAEDDKDEKVRNF